MTDLKYCSKFIYNHPEERLTDKDWEKALIEHMTSHGWLNDRNDENYVGFTWPEVTETEQWMRDYNKKTRSFVNYNGKQKVNIKVIK